MPVGPTKAVPTFRILRHTVPRVVCVPLLAWEAMFGRAMRSLDDCPLRSLAAPAVPDITSGAYYLVAPGAHPGSTPALAKAAKSAWVLVPAAG